MAPERQFPSWTLLLAVCSVGIGGTFQYGYNVSIINAPTQHIHKFLNETWASRYHVELNPDLLTFLWSVIASIFSLGGLCGALIGGSMAIQLGRKGALLMNNAIAILAALLMGISFPTGLFELLIVGRFLVGINSGEGFPIPAFSTLWEILGAEAYWPLLLSSSCVPAFAQLLFLPWFPESPRYLLIDRGDELSCAKALKRFHGSSQYQREMEDIQRECSALDGEKAKKPWQLFADRAVRWQLVTVIVVTMGQQLSGINAVRFDTWGLLIDCVGRRYLILGGYLLMTLWSIVLTFSLTYQVYTRLSKYELKLSISLLFQELYSWVPYVSMASIFAFILSFGLGPGGITNTLTAEIFVQSSCPAACVIGGTVSWVSFFTIGMLFPFIVRGLKQYCFVVFLLECSLVAAFIFLVIPETKNKSFLEIKKEFHKLNFGGKSKEKDTELNERSQLHDDY
ncbi:hypothetical protein ASZ78_008779 [Callipepla squamata]|uniref:Major facilitator superfamily (MFS) profile domain-containing protein n=1 Tax=Callipepla squamata TaxID=9009 RepID=A0A226NAS6_CALSU|nr:hypothetical protein ASZ78_008779 [Callipepla squamata]